MRYLTPGPTQTAACVEDAIKRAVSDGICSISHRSKRYEEIHSGTVNGIRELLSIPNTHHIFFLGSATEAWERIIQNCSFSRTHHFVNGSFSERFYAISRELGRNASQTKVELGEGFDLCSVTVPTDIELLCVTQNETSTGVYLSSSDISALAQRFPSALVAVDIVSCAPINDLNWSDIDCGFFSVQKCFGLPAGLGVLIVSERAVGQAEEVRSKGLSIGSYHSIPTLLAAAKKNQTPETPNVLGIFLLGEVIKGMLEIGVQKLRSSVINRAQQAYARLDKLRFYKPFVSKAPFRSPTVLPVITPFGSQILTKGLLAEGYELGAGYATLKDKQVRIANFPMHTDSEIDLVISRIEELDNKGG